MEISVRTTSLSTDALFSCKKHKEGPYTRVGGFLFLSETYFIYPKLRGGSTSYSTAFSQSRYVRESGRMFHNRG